MSKTEIILKEAICPVCRKKFFYYPEYVYKIYSNGYKRVCSWNCQMAFEKGKKEKSDDESRDSGNSKANSR